ncbi:MAG: hypothetical protein AAFO72_09835 [Pseudomonadota bacterium]
MNEKSVGAFALALGLSVGLSVAPSSPLFAEEYQETHLCDDFAAHPADPNRWAAGVDDVDIIPGPAVKHCRDAVKRHPDTARFHFQLGRALWANNRMEDGLQSFLHVEETFQYGPAYAYLGDAYMYGIAGLDVDPELAITLYQVSEEEGFAPAGDVLAALSEESPGEAEPYAAFENNAHEPEPEAAPERQQAEQSAEQSTVETAQPSQTAQAEQPLRVDLFHQKKAMQALYDGDLQALRMGEVAYLNVDKSFIYLSGFIEPFQENLNFRDESCIFLANPNLQRILAAKLVRSTPTGGMLLGNGRSLEQNLNAGAEQGFQMLGEMFRGMQSGQGAYTGGLGDLARSGVLKENGVKDATRLIAAYGCQSATVQRIFANITTYVTGRGQAIMSDDLKERRDQEAREAAERKKRQQEEAAIKAEELRQASLRTGVQQSCMKQFENSAYCSCALTSLDNYSISDAEWAELTASFRSVVAVSRAHSGLGGDIRACRNGG